MSTFPAPSSCDTFVVLPEKTKGGHVVFGKNSDRPAEEVQEVIYQPKQDHDVGSKLQCTYIEIDQVLHTHAIILSKPAWMWGAEMGANEHGVCVGNEAVWTKVESDEDKEERLLGMDLVRLSLERGSTAEAALEVITSLLEKHGQGGPCSDSDPDLIYHNSFLIADPTSAWVLETAGIYWAAEKVTGGFRNISNELSIKTNIDKMSLGLKEKAQAEGWWDGTSEFDFTASYGTGDGSKRKICGAKLLENLSAGGEFTLTNMFEVLRDKDSEICRGTDHSNPTASSMVSVLAPSESGRPSCHWITGTPDPQRSVFKPFIFTPNVKISPYIQSPKFTEDEDPAKSIPRFTKAVNRAHLLYRRQQAATENGGCIIETLQELEAKCVQETEDYLNSFDMDRLHEMDDLFKDIVDSELKFYK